LFIPSETYPSEVSLDIWLALAYLGICGSFLGFVWYYQGISKIGPVRTAAYNNLIPVFAMLLSVIILGESIALYTLYGSLLVIGGVYLVNRY
jgi:drug/metabolite transporter (DMT)-like permease